MQFSYCTALKAGMGEWGTNPVYHKTNVTCLLSFLKGKLASWASNGCCVEEIWKGFKERVFKSIDLFV
jgi:hypothetical protein